MTAGGSDNYTQKKWQLQNVSWWNYTNCNAKLGQSRKVDALSVSVGRFCESMEIKYNDWQSDRQK